MFSAKHAINLAGSRQQKFKGKLSRSLCKVRNSDILEWIYQQKEPNSSVTFPGSTRIICNFRNYMKVSQYKLTYLTAKLCNFSFPKYFFVLYRALS